MAELILGGGVGDTLPDIAQQVLGIAHELVAGVQSPQGVTAMYSVPEPQPEIRL